MKVTVVMVRVVTKEEYRHGEQRLLESYQKHDPYCEHDLVIIDRCGDSPDDVPGAKHIRYDGGGWDCGAWQFAGRAIDTELLVCFNSSCQIKFSGWLRRFVEAAEKYGTGLYGPMTSNEVVPHVRTPCMIFQPEVINSYPREVQTREDTYRFESMGWPDGTPNFTQWVKQQGWATMLVTHYGAHGMATWRNPPHIFRRGNQNNLLVQDRHCEAYAISDDQNKRMLEGLAGLADPAYEASIDKYLFDTRADKGNWWELK